MNTRPYPRGDSNLKAVNNLMSTSYLEFIKFKFIIKKFHFNLDEKMYQEITWGKYLNIGLNITFKKKSKHWLDNKPMMERWLSPGHLI